jgi:plastocyanin
MRTVTRTGPVVTAGLLVLLLAGCADEGGSEGTTADAPADPADPSADEPDDVAAEDAEVALVDEGGFAYEPDELTVAAGTSVTWIHEGEAPHTVTAEDGSFASDTLEAGDRFEHTFDEPGSFAYVCDFHPQMQGTVTVE